MIGGRLRGLLGRLRGRLGAVGVVAGLLDDLLGRPRSSVVGCRGTGARPRGARASRSRVAPAQDSSSPKPATTSRRAPSWAVMASRRLVTRSTSAWMLASSRSASACRVALIESAWVRAEATTCSASRRARLSRPSASLWACWTVGVGLGRRLARPLLGSVGALLGLGDEPLGLGGGVAVVLGRLAGQPLLLHRQGAARLLHLAVRGGAGLLGLAGRGGAHLVGLLLGGQSQLVGLAPGGGEQVLRLGLGQRALGLGVSGEARPHLVELLELDHAHVVGLAGGVGADALGVAARPCGSRRRRVARPCGRRWPRPRRA